MGAGPGAPVTQQQRIRYQACYNTSDYDAPPFAAMQRNGGTQVDKVFSWNVSRPDSTTESRQNPTDIVFNGPEVLPKKSPGRCTVDYPARCLHAIADTIAPDWISASISSSAIQLYFVGPKADSWLLWSGGRAFTWEGADRALDDNFEVGIVALPSTSFYGASYVIANVIDENFAHGIPANGGIVGKGAIPSAPTISDGAWVLGLGRFPSHVDFQVNGATTYSLSGYPRIPRTGIYEWHFHCSAYSLTAPQGASIPIHCFADNERLGLYVIRTQQNEIDNYGNELSRTLENLSMTGINHFIEGEVINFRNFSAYVIDVTAAFFWLRRVT